MLPIQPAGDEQSALHVRLPSPQEIFDFFTAGQSLGCTVTS